MNRWESSHGRHAGPRILPLAAGQRPTSAGVPALGEPFRVLRQALGLGQHELAQRLGTHPFVIDALERGAVRDLPPWPEVVRVVSSMTQSLGIDPRPMLTALAHAIDATFLPAAADPGRSAPNAWEAPPALAYAPPAEHSVHLPAIANEEDFASEEDFEEIEHSLPRPRTRRLRYALWLAGPILLIALLAQSHGLRAAIGKLPRPAARVARQLTEFVLSGLAPQREGLRWIEVADPRTRRGDKLPIRHR